MLRGQPYCAISYHEISLSRIFFFFFACGATRTVMNSMRHFQHAPARCDHLLQHDSREVPLQEIILLQTTLCAAGYMLQVVLQFQLNEISAVTQQTQLPTLHE